MLRTTEFLTRFLVFKRLESRYYLFVVLEVPVSSLLNISAHRTAGEGGNFGAVRRNKWKVSYYPEVKV